MSLAVLLGQIVAIAAILGWPVLGSMGIGVRWPIKGMFM